MTTIDSIIAAALNGTTQYSYGMPIQCPKSTYEVRMQRFIRNIISLLMVVFVSSNPERLPHNKMHRAEAIVISDRTSNTAKGTMKSYSKKDINLSNSEKNV